MSSLKIKRSRNNLQSWIKGRDILKNTNEVELSQCLKLIINVFGKKKQFVDFLLKYASIEQSNTIYKIIKNEKIKCKELENKTETIEESEAFKESPNFGILSNESITNICHYLSVKDIKYFKLVSRRTAIVCLQEMNRYSIGINDINKIITSPLIITNKTFPNNWSYHRYNNITTYSSILHDVEKNHKIPEKYQIPIATKFNHISKCYEINKSEAIKPKTSLIILDKRNIIVLNDKECRKMRENDKFKFDKNRFVILQQFDVINQIIKIPHCLMVNHDTLTMDILNKFVRNQLFNQYNTLYDHIQISFFAMTTRYDYKTTNNIHTMAHWNFNKKGQKVVMLGFQLNISSQNELYVSLRDQYEISNLKPFYEGISIDHRLLNKDDEESNHLIKIYHIDESLLRLKKQIKEIKDYNEENIDQIFGNGLQLNVNNRLSIDALKRYLSNICFNRLIPAQNIQFYYKNNQNQIEICNHCKNDQLLFEIKEKL